MPRLSNYKNSRFFQDPAGNPVYLCGFTATPYLYYNDLDYRTVLQQIGQTGINLIRLELDAYDLDPEVWITPYKRSKSSRRTSNGFRRFDLTALNPSFWERTAALLKHARLNNLFVQLSLFQSPSDPADRSLAWVRSAWNPANNIHEEELAALLPVSDPQEAEAAFTSVCSTESDSDENGFLLERQQELIRAALDASEESLHHCFSLEASRAPVEWIRFWAESIQDSTDAPVIIPLNFADEKELAQVSGYTVSSPDEERERMNTIAKKVVLSDETVNGTDAPPDRLYRNVWTAFMERRQWIYTPEESRLARYAQPNTGEGTDSHAYPPPLNESHLRAVSSVRRFIRERRVRYWTMQTEKESSGLSYLVRPGERYLAYTNGSPITLQPEGRSAYTITWWNLRDEYLVTQGAVFGGGERSLPPPDAGDWVLDLAAKVR